MFEYGIIQALQQWSAPWLDRLFIIITFSGEEDFYLILLPLLFWVVDRQIGARVIVLFLASMFLNQAVKDYLTMPRPDPAQVRVLFEESGVGYGFPSGHAQGTLTLWGYLAYRWAVRPLIIFAAVLVPLVGLSRVYLGLHFPSDVLGGWALAGLLIAGFVLAERHLSGLRSRSLAIALLPLLALLVYRDADAYKIVGYAVGFLAGYGTGTALAGEARGGGAVRLVLKVVVGFAGFELLRQVTGMITPDGPWQVLRYAVVGIWAADLAPRLFQRSGLEPAADRGTAA
ncbi:MAG: phosphatase PAP2 family protein [Thermaerobacterales bacterium]